MGRPLEPEVAGEKNLRCGASLRQSKTTQADPRMCPASMKVTSTPVAKGHGTIVVCDATEVIEDAQRVERGVKRFDFLR